MFENKQFRESEPIWMVSESVAERAERAGLGTAYSGKRFSKGAEKEKNSDLRFLGEMPDKGINL